MDLGSLTLDEFLRRLASSEPVPGGGSLAAVAGAQAAAMLAMVCNLTIGRPRYAAVEGEVRAILAEAGDLQERLVQLANRDVAAYLAVREAYRLPRTTEEERVVRSDAVGRAMQVATEVPLETAEAAREVLALARRAARCTNVSALGDVAVAGYLAVAAARGAADQARLNLGGLSDSAFSAAVAGRIEHALHDIEGEVATISAAVFERAAPG